MIKTVTDFFKSKDVKYKEGVNLASISPLHIGGLASLIAYPCTVEQLILIAGYLQKNEIPYKIIGRMTNILFTAEKVAFVLVSTRYIKAATFSDNVLHAECGAFLPHLALLSAELGLSGFEELSGIPASVGGAVRSNAGAFGREISELISSVTVYDVASVSVIELSPSECDFSYRHSAFRDNKRIVLSADFKLSRSEENISSKINYFKQKRKETQPVGEHSIGSTFKRPAGAYAAEMIDRCGLKGRRVGGVKISEKHAGFIVNAGFGTAQDYLNLMEIARRAVYERFGVMLENEIEIF